jgi:hypothetical protein
LNNRLWIYVVSLAAVASLAGPVGAVTAAAPSIEAQWVAGVTSTDATLHAEINPNGLQTHYKLQIDTTGNFKFDQNDSCPLHPPGIFCAQVVLPGDPLPPGLVQPVEYTLPAGSESRHVSVNMASIGATLQPGTTYHYRAIAANESSFLVEGDAQTFTTPAEPEPPTGESEPESEAIEDIFEIPADDLKKAPGDQGGFGAIVDQPTAVTHRPALVRAGEVKLRRDVDRCRRKSRDPRTGPHNRGPKHGSRTNCTRVGIARPASR